MDEIKYSYIYPIVVTSGIITIFYAIGVTFTLQLTHNYRRVPHLKAFHEVSGTAWNHLKSIKSAIHRSISKTRTSGTDESIPFNANS